MKISDDNQSAVTHYS